MKYDIECSAASIALRHIFVCETKTQKSTTYPVVCELTFFYFFFHKIAKFSDLHFRHNKTINMKADNILLTCGSSFPVQYLTFLQNAIGTLLMSIGKECIIAVQVSDTGTFFGDC